MAMSRDEDDARGVEGECALAFARQAVRVAEDLVSSKWLLHLLELEQELETALRVARHLQDGARADVRSAQRAGEPGRIVEAQRALEDAQQDFAKCFELHRRVRTVARREGDRFALASRARTSGALADQARIDALTSVSRRKSGQ